MGSGEKRQGGRGQGAGGKRNGGRGAGGRGEEERLLSKQPQV
ncbi:hypothetical protein NSP_28360 [Nodularia spumigena CCY9414]|nr:hypothetical protein NSP_28360 [Nodularia spumigena CCY9414]EAW45873.1 hypothetical protein N9414_15762 [Nodularia spumigena CCY9414]